MILVHKCIRKMKLMHPSSSFPLPFQLKVVEDDLVLHDSHAHPNSKGEQVAAPTTMAGGAKDVHGASPPLILLVTATTSMESFSSSILKLGKMVVLTPTQKKRKWQLQ